MVPNARLAQALLLETNRIAQKKRNRMFFEKDGDIFKQRYTVNTLRKKVRGPRYSLRR